MLSLILNSKRAQNTVEYALMIAVIIGAFTAMQLYARRGMQARIKGGVDSIPGLVLQQETDSEKVKDLLGTDTQYEPYYYREGAYNMTSITGEGTEKGTVSESGGVKELTGATTQRHGTQETTGTENAD